MHACASSSVSPAGKPDNERPTLWHAACSRRSELIERARYLPRRTLFSAEGYELYMSRFQGFPDPEGLLILDSATGELILVTRSGDRRILNPARVDPIRGTAPPATVTLFANAPAVAGAPPPAVPGERAAAEPPSASNLDLPAEIEDLDREIVLTFPYPIARPYLDLLNERDPRLRCKLLVDTFTSVLKVWALIVASEYLRATDVKDAQVHKTLARDLARPLISAWSLLLQRALPVLRDAKVAPFAPELGRAYEALETKCKQRFLVSESYVDDAGQTQTRTKKLGKIQALIAYRNGLAHGFNQNAKQAQRDLDTYLPLLKEILREARFLARYPLWHVSEGQHGPDHARGYRLMGARPSANRESVDAADLDPRLSPLFLKNEATGEVLPLFAFFDVHEVEDGGLPGLGGDVFLFEGNTKGTVIYVSATGEHAEKATRFTHWQSLLAAKAVDVELLSSETLSLHALKAASGRIANQAIDALVTSGKYLREASVDRPDLEEHLAAFEYGKFGAFVVGGESGIGKSTLLARYVERRREAGDAVVFYRASALPSADVAGRMLRDLGLSGMYLEDFQSTAASLFREGARFLLVIDAVNEFPGDVAELVRQIDQAVQQSSGHDWFRVIASVRDSAYQRLPSDARFGSRGIGRYLTVEEDRGAEKVRTPVVSLRPLGKDHVEALYEAYRSYRQRDPDDPESPGLHRFRPKTEWAELDRGGSTRSLMGSPLMARLVLEAHHRRTLTSDLRSDQAMRLYLDSVVVEVNAADGGFPGRRRFLTALVRELDRASADTLPRDSLTQSAGLRRDMLNPQRDSAYVQLVELGVLLEEWEADTCYVRFAFDRLFEYLLAELHDPRVQSAADAVALARRAIGFRSLRGALEAILGRACEQGREALVTELIDVASEDSDDSLQRMVTETAVALFVRLAREKDAAFGRIVEAMPKAPSKADVRILCDVADKLALLGEVDSEETVIAALIVEAEALGDSREVGQAWLRRGNRLRVIGDNQGERAALERSLTHASTAGDSRTRAEALRWLGSLARRLGDHGEASRLLKESLEISRNSDHAVGVANALMSLSALAWAQDDDAAFRECCLEALGIWRALDNKVGVGKCLNNLGTFARDNLAESERLHREALALQRDIGDRSGVGTSLSHLGDAVLARGDLTEAKRLYEEAFAIRSELRNKSGIAQCLNALGRVASLTGDLQEAETHYRALLGIRRELGNKARIAASASKLGAVLEFRGNYAEAESLRRESLAMRVDLGNNSGIQYQSYALVALLAVQQRAPDRTLFEETHRLADELNVPRAHALGAQSSVLAFPFGDTPTAQGLAPLLDAMRAARAAEEVIPDVEDGPATPFFVAARWLAERGEHRLAAELAREALDEVGDRFWPYREETDAIARRAGAAP
jgi:tetratricopeptide (TPR) repeat protein